MDFRAVALPVGRLMVLLSLFMLVPAAAALALFAWPDSEAETNTEHGAAPTDSESGGED